MSESSNARASRIMDNVSRGVYQKNGKFRGYGESEVDRPSWDFRPIVKRHGDMLYFQNDRRLKQNGQK